MYRDCISSVVKDLLELADRLYYLCLLVTFAISAVDGCSTGIGTDDQVICIVPESR